LGGADLSGEAGLLVPAALYYLLARRRIPVLVGAFSHD